MADDMTNRGASYATLVLFGTIGSLVGWDLAADFSQGIGLRHLLIELAVLAMTMLGVGILWWQLRQARSNLATARIEAAQWHAENHELLRGLGAAIDKQFGRWQLTNAESEVALLLLKGLSHKEIATVRNTSERTIREQARGVYRKAGLPGRSALSAFFLEDLLLPDSLAQDATQQVASAADAH